MERLAGAQVTGQGGQHDGGGSERNEAVWERPWSLEEIRNSSESWSLAADAGLLNFLQEFSQQTISKTHEIEKQLDGLIRDTKTTNCRLHNVFNDFLMLSNTQFIENRVYDEDIAEPVPKSDAGDKPEQEKTREQKEAELIPKVQEAVNFGLQVLESAFEQLDIKAGNSDSEEEEINERVEPILEPKDLYIDRPLPYLIGSKLFMEQEDVGLGDFSSEEGSIDSDRASGVDSEDEQDERESDDNSDNRSEEQRLQTVLSDEEDDDGSNLFDSEKEEDEDLIEENTKSEKRPRPTSFADELAARIKGDTPNKPSEEQESLSSAESITKLQGKEKKETRTVPSDDDDDEEEDDMFKPPKLTDEDFSPFGTQGGLFSGGRGLFDDDEEDLFVEAPRAKKVKERKIKTPVTEEPSPSNPVRKVPVGGVSLFPGADPMFNPSSVLAEKDKSKTVTPKTETAPKLPTPSSGLFDDDDDDFFGKTKTKPTTAGKSAATVFVQEGEAERFNEKPVLPTPTQSNAITQSQAVKEKIGKKTPSPEEPKSLPQPSLKTPAKGLFSDEEDAEDLFSPSTNVTKPKTSTLPASKPSKALSLFDDEEEDSLFSTAPAKTQIAKKTPQDKIKAEESFKTVGSSLFSSDEEDSWNRAKTVKPIPEQTQKDNITKPSQPKDQIEKVEKKASLFDEWDGAKTTKPISEQTQKDNIAKPGQPKDQIEKVEKKTSLFDEEDDLFAITKKDSTKKSQRASLLFEEEATNDVTLFPAVPASSPPALPILEKVQSEPLPTSSFKETKDDVLVQKAERKLPELKTEAEKKPEDSEVFGKADAFVEPKKEKVQTPVSAIPDDDEDDDDLFLRLPPPDVEDKKVKKNVLSLFDEDDDDDNLEDQLMNRNVEKEIKMLSDDHSHSKSTGVFQDEELLFSHKLQMDNDPDVDLFANAKKPVSEKPASRKLSSGAGLFGDEDEDDLFSTTKPKPPPMTPEKKMGSRKGNTDTPKDINYLPQRQDVREAAALHESGGKQEKLEQKPADPGQIKTKDPDSRIGKLQANLTINPATLLPGAAFKAPGAKPTSSAVGVAFPRHGGEASDTGSAAKSKKEGVGVSFDHPANVSILHSANKDRIKVAGKRRPPSRAGRRLASQDSGETEEFAAAAPAHPPFAEDTTTISDTKWSQTEVPKANRSKAERAVNDIAVPPSSPNGDVSSGKSARISEKVPPSDLPAVFDSDVLFAKSAESKTTVGRKSKEKSNEGLAKKHRKAEKKSSLPALDGQASDDDLFQSTKPKSTKTSAQPSLFGKDGEEDLFDGQKINKKKEAKTTSGREPKPQIPNIFEDDIFASEAIQPAKKIKEKEKAVDIFDDDDIDIFADLTVKPKEKKTMKKVEPKSIFDDEMDDIFASGNKVKTSKSRTEKSALGAKSERKGSFDDPLNAFGGP